MATYARNKRIAQLRNDWAFLILRSRRVVYNSFCSMPYCKSCHKEISRLDNDVCPYCGEVDPIASDYATKDVTSSLDPVTGKYELYKSKSLKAYVILCMCLGFLGAHDFYAGFWKRGIVFLTSFLIIVGGAGSLIFFLAWNSFWIYLILFLAYIASDIALGLLLNKKAPLKDAEGEYLR